MTSLLCSHSSLQTLGGVAAGSVSPWPMARLDTSQLKSFNARRKWHVSVCVCVRACVHACVCAPRERHSRSCMSNVYRTPPHVSTPSLLTPSYLHLLMHTHPHSYTPSPHTPTDHVSCSRSCHSIWSSFYPLCQPPLSQL